MENETGVRDLFDQWANAGMGEEMETGHRDVAEQAVGSLRFGAADQALDLGCGTGWGARMMRGKGAARVVGVDLSPAMVARARPDLGVAYLVGSAHALPFRDAAFTRLLSVEAAYYWADLQTALGEARRVCAPAATFACVVDLYRENPGAHGWVDALDVAVHLLSIEDYADRFRRAGFSKVATRQVRDRRPVVSESHFRPNRWFRAYKDYRVYRELGALVIQAAT